MAWMCSNIASSSTMFRFFTFCQRVDGGVPARNPKNSRLVSDQGKASVPRSLDHNQSMQRRNVVASLPADS